MPGLMRIASITLAALLVASCMGTAPVRPPLHEMPAYDGPVSPEALAGRLAFSALEQVPGMSAEVRASIYRSGKKKGNFGGVIGIRQPDDIKLILQGAMGGTVLDMVRSDGTMEAYLPSKDTLYVGSAPSLMPPPGSALMLTMVEHDEGAGEYELTASIGGRVVRSYSFDARSALNTRATVYERGRPHMMAAFSGYAAIVNSTLPLPQEISIEHAAGFRVEFIIKDPETGRAIPDKFFRLGRAAAKVHDLDAFMREESPALR